MTHDIPKPDPPEAPEDANPELDSEDALFEKAMQGELTDVSQARRPGRDFSALEAKARRLTASAALEAKARRLAASDALFERAAAVAAPPSRTPSLERDEEKGLNTQGILRRLHAGEIPADQRIDLHGLTLDNALTHLRSELRAAMNRGARTAVVITGKGLHSRGRPRLRDAVPGWLKTECGQWVEGVGAAPPRLGGEGALLVVLLRAARSQMS